LLLLFSVADFFSRTKTFIDIDDDDDDDDDDEEDRRSNYKNIVFPLFIG
jgi:hypothetical protein